MKKLSEVRVGVIGVGGMGTGHVRRFENGTIKRGRVTAVCDIDPRKMDKFSDDYRKFTDSRELIRSGEVDAVVIATPHYFHTTIGIDALDARIAVADFTLRAGDAGAAAEALAEARSILVRIKGIELFSWNNLL